MWKWPPCSSRMKRMRPSFRSAVSSCASQMRCASLRLRKLISRAAPVVCVPQMSTSLQCTGVAPLRASFFCRSTGRVSDVMRSEMPCVYARVVSVSRYFAAHVRNTRRSSGSSFGHAMSRLVICWSDPCAAACLTSPSVAKRSRLSYDARHISDASFSGAPCVCGDSVKTAKIFARASGRLRRAMQVCANARTRSSFEIRGGACFFVPAMAPVCKR